MNNEVDQLDSNDHGGCLADSLPSVAPAALKGSEGKVSPELFTIDEKVATIANVAFRKAMAIARCFTTNRYRAYWMEEPWVKDGMLYATDARIILRWPAPGEPDTDIKGKAAPVAELPWSLSGTSYPIPRVGPQPYIDELGTDDDGNRTRYTQPELDEPGVEVGCSLLAAFYLRQLLLCGVTHITVSDDPNKPVTFTGPDGLTGILMPRKKC